MTRLQMLRQERHPLVALTAVAFAARLCLLILASALTPDAAVATGLTGLCQSSGLERTSPASHDPLTCQCGPVCSHGCVFGPGLLTLSAATNPDPFSGAGAEAAATTTTLHRQFERTRAIRAPPLSLI
ncbi:hypothetical protein WNZ15_18115 [Roseibium sp. AS2]|uniref:hypothetical protein n=1 Tax=Roseibium sp. AS2 TaxID=3135781 RepID=UPI0031731F12